MRVAVWILVEVELPFLLKHRRKPRIVPPVGLNDDGIVWPLNPEELIDRIRLAPRVP
jgi:hypothetical protein